MESGGPTVHILAHTVDIRTEGKLRIRINRSEWVWRRAFWIQNTDICVPPPATDAGAVLAARSE